MKVVGSLNLVQTLLREKLFDRLDLWMHPVVLGVGKKVFDGGAVPTNVTLLEHERTRSRRRPRRRSRPAPREGSWSIPTRSRLGTYP